jgi:hypothetical protein
VLGVLLAAGDPSKAGDLAGNLPWGVWLLIPLAIVLAVVTMLALGSGAEPTVAKRRAGGVARALHTDAPSNPDPD